MSLFRWDCLLRGYGYLSKLLCSAFPRSLGLLLSGPSISQAPFSPQDEGEYLYRPLESDDHIRVVELLPAQHRGDQICCRILHMSHLRPSHSYTAISYAWGDDNDALKIAINCDGRLARVTPNLHAALVRVRKMDKSLFVWTDALCIDQGRSPQGLAEKAQQVQNIDRTFSRAEQVMMDLGSESSSDVLAVLDRYYNIPLDTWEQAYQIVQTQSFNDCFQFLSGFQLPGVRDAFWRALVCFMQRPWFSRVWIIQEYALAKRATFLIGDDQRPGTYLPQGVIRALQHMVWLYHSDRRRGPGQGQPSEEFAQCVWAFDQPHVSALLIRDARDALPKGLPLHSLLWRTKRFLAKDERDKVYAILGLLEGGKSKDRIPVNYTDESVEQLGMRVARHLIQTGFGPYVLYNCLATSSPVHSWALVLTEPNLDAFSELYRPSGQFQNSVYNACGNTQFSFRWGPVSQSDIPNDRLLIVRGCIVDKIYSTGPDLPYPNTITHQQVAGQSAWLAQTWDWMTAVQEEIPKVPPHQFTLQGWQTATADLIIPPEREGEGYVRASNIAITPLCLEAVDNTARHASTKARNVEHEFVPTMPLNEDFAAYINMLSESFRYSFGRKLALTQDRHLTCCVPRETRDGDDGDYICIILGCPTPFVLRRAEDHYRLVGPCYVYNLMDGQALVSDFWKEEDIEIR
ncbi:hypothetical protein A1O1_04464 [Capronia coronata CBS 617.96]|uniref:Heterokaryon incompatibility domain-containing protein n=1 Tax=Capronia coronata CBS 617.96 TaxID=1182541 RepID=W9YES8_9EURO|nr:uncharacterized protein A1O1_04464 [Capronia coronata CBS 617.96]EXJ91352.1 hypothetical protein A1O1_04464 [Capronia coronata CBS 617.96]